MVELLFSALFFLATLPIALLILRGAGAFFLAPVISAVLAIFAAVIHVLTDVPLAILWGAGALLGASGLLLASPRNRIFQNLLALKDSRQQSLLWIYLGFVALSSLATPAPVGWDARSMWFAIPSWLNGPAEFYITGQSASYTGWPEYPFFSPATLATIWQLLGIDEDLWLASRVSGAMGITMAALAAWLIVDRYASRCSTLWTSVIFASAVATSFFLADGTLNNGYQDAMQGLSVSALLAGILWALKKQPHTGLVLVSVLALAASNVKQEGFWFTLGVMILGLGLHAFNNSYLISLSLIAPLAFRLVWGWFGSVVGMPESGSTQGMGERAPELLDASSTAWSVIGKIMSVWFPQYHLGWVTIAIASAIALFLISARELGWRRLLEPLVLVGSVMGIYVVILVTYAIGASREAIDWWLGTSYTRITATPVALALLGLLIVSAKAAPEAKTVVTKSRTKKR